MVQIVGQPYHALPSLVVLPIILPMNYCYL